MNQALTAATPPLPDTPTTALNATTLADIRDTIARQPWLFRLPAVLLGDFRHRREAEFARLAVIGMPLLLLLLLCDYLIGVLINGAELHGADRTLWLHLMSFSTVTLLLAFGFTRVRALNSSYLLWVGLLSGMVLGAKLYLGIAASSPRLGHTGLEMAAMMIIVIMLAMRLTVSAATITCLGAGALTVAIALMQHIAFDFPFVAKSFFGTTAVCFFVAMLLDRQDRLNFLQAVVLSHDAIELVRLNRQLEYLSQTDGLSGLANRRHFDTVLAREWERAQRDGSSIAIVFADVDHFKAYNDTYGHLAGDDCLRRVGAALGTALRRPADLAARYGGEEFVILLPNTDNEGAHEVAERALAAVDALRVPHSKSSAGAQVTISIGLATLVPEATSNATHLLDAADTALYAAKQQGRHRIVEMPLRPTVATLHGDRASGT